VTLPCRERHSVVDGSDSGGGEEGWVGDVSATASAAEPQSFTASAAEPKVTTILVITPIVVPVLIVVVAARGAYVYGFTGTLLRC
jgi:hypothetical protein